MSANADGEASASVAAPAVVRKRRRGMRTRVKDTRATAVSPTEFSSAANIPMFKLGGNIPICLKTTFECWCNWRGLASIPRFRFPLIGGTTALREFSKAEEMLRIASGVTAMVTTWRRSGMAHLARLPGWQARSEVRWITDLRRSLANGYVAPKPVIIGRPWSERAKPTQTGGSPCVRLRP